MIYMRTKSCHIILPLACCIWQYHVFSKIIGLEQITYKSDKHLLTLNQLKE